MNDPEHRVQSSAAAMQKALYHLFMLQDSVSADEFARVMRTYQALFFLRSSQVLLDLTYTLEARSLPGRLRSFCGNDRAPRGDELDPAALLTHTTIATGWRSFPESSPLCAAGYASRELLERTDEARHNLVYRPFHLLHRFEDCALETALAHVPDAAELEGAFAAYAEGISTLCGAPVATPGAAQARRFRQRVVATYEDTRPGADRPTESLFATYARMLAPQSTPPQRHVDAANRWITELGARVSAGERRRSTDP